MQSHPARATLAHALAARVPGSRVVWDPDPDGHPSAWRTYRECLVSAAAGGAMHACIIQDDVTPVPGFERVLGALSAAQPDAAVALFHGGAPRENVWRLQAACASDLPLCELDSRRWCPVVALLWPTVLIGPTLAWVDAKGWPIEFSADDEIVGQALRGIGAPPVLATVPSLVEHEDIVPSITGLKAWAGADPARVAWCFDPGLDLDGLDWTLPPFRGVTHARVGTDLPVADSHDNSAPADEPVRL